MTATAVGRMSMSGRIALMITGLFLAISTNQVMAHGDKGNVGNTACPVTSP
jgi:hypothetical protein